MGSVIYDKSMSLDGFIAAENMRPEAGLGDDGQRLHDWVFEDPAGMEMIQQEVSRLGAVICGRTTPKRRTSARQRRPAPYVSAIRQDPRPRAQAGAPPSPPDCPSRPSR